MLPLLRKIQCQFGAENQTNKNMKCTLVQQKELIKNEKHTGARKMNIPRVQRTKKKIRISCFYVPASWLLTACFCAGFCQAAGFSPPASCCPATPSSLSSLGRDGAVAMACNSSNLKLPLRGCAENLRKPQLTHVNVKSDATGPASMSVQDAIANVAVFWRQIWHRPKLNVHTVWPEIQQLVPNHNPAVWAPLTGAHLKAAAYDSRNRAAGPDGWTPRELNLFNTDMWKAVADFYSHCLVVGMVPEIWKCFRQVQLGKGDIAPTAEFVYAKQLRPICVSSLIRRVCQKAQFNHTDAQIWIRSVFPSCFYGGIKGRGTDDAIAPLLFKAHQDWFIGSLDLAKAFDTTSPQLAAKILLRCGMPQNILTLVLDVWENQKRWIQYLGQISPEPELVRNSLPQGDSWSMLAMLAVLYPCVLAIQHEFPDVDHVLYADDRSFAAPSA